MANVQRMRAGEYQSDLLRAQAAEQAAQQAAQSPYGQMVNQLEAGRPERTSRGEILFDLDPITGRLREVSQGLKGATPETFQNFGANLASGAQKVSEGKLFDMTLAEKVAWERTKVDLAEAAPGLNRLTDAQIAEKMMDRAWVADTVKKAREKAAAFDEIAKRAEDAQAARAAAIKRDQLLDTLDALEEQLRAPRPVELGGQGPKTRAARAEANPGRSNMLAPEAPAPVNQLIMPQSVGSGPRPQSGPVEVTAGPSLASRRPPPPPAPPPPPSPPPAPPTPPAPPAPPATPSSLGGDTTELVKLFKKVDKGFEPSEKQLNSVESLQHHLDRLINLSDSVAAEPMRFMTSAEAKALPKLIDALGERIELLKAGVANSPTQAALKDVLQKAFNYSPQQVAKHFSSRAGLERALNQAKGLLETDRQLLTSQKGPYSPYLQDIVTLLEQRLKEIK
jgi:hypothetical protein